MDSLEAIAATLAEQLEQCLGLLDGGAEREVRAVLERYASLANWPAVVAASADPGKSERAARIVTMAMDQHHEEGTCEVDESALVSEGEDNGAYVQAWVWVGFSGTDLDKGDSDEH